MGLYKQLSGVDSSDQETSLKYNFYDFEKKFAVSLLTHKRVESLLKTGVNPIKVSILKWQKIHDIFTELADIFSFTIPNLENLRNFIGYQTCALCLESINIYKRKNGNINSREDKCSVCSLKSIDWCLESKSTFGQIDRALRNFDSKSFFSLKSKQSFIDLMNKLFNKMINNLEQIEINNNQK